MGIVDQDGSARGLALKLDQAVEYDRKIQIWNKRNFFQKLFVSLPVDELKGDAFFGNLIIGKAADIDIIFRPVLPVGGNDFVIKNRETFPGLVLLKKRIQIDGRRNIPAAFHDDKAVKFTAIVSGDRLNGNGFRILDFCLQAIHDRKLEFFVCHFLN